MSDSQDKAGKDDFHRERSRFLDAFASLEEVLLGSPANLKDESLAKQIKALRLVRNDLVHSQLRFVQLEGQLQAIAINAQDAATIAKLGRVVRIGDFRALCSQISEVKRSLV
jgi:hypothetical protein